MTGHFLTLAIGLGCAAAGGELFVRGVVGIAEAARIPPGIVGATVAAFGTSSPEISVAVSSAISDRPQLALGDALGSNVVNIGLVLGLAVLVGPIRVGRGTIRRDMAAALVIPLATVALAADGYLGRPDAIVLLGAFFIWLLTTIAAARRERSAATEILAEHSLPRAAFVCVVGLLVLVAAGRLIVVGAKGIGTDLGLDSFVVGVVFVAIGTSVPELATAIVSRLRGHEEIGLGTVLGSNVFNGALIVPIVALIAPFRVEWSEIAISLFFGVVVIVAVLPFPRPILERGRGGVLVTLYGSSVLALLLTHG
ncbi:MAG TPA: calcium/sodium antiporter [Gaiellaceae bacterium]|nr:calcium/sodium antiporter [Gaiellaceae bacterium]